MGAFHNFRHHLRESWYCFDFDLRERRNDAKALRVGKHLMPTAEFAGAPAGAEHRKRVAIVAMYPTDSVTFSILNLLTALRSTGFWILIVSTKPLEGAQRQLIIKNCNHLIERFPIGRDFGSYQLGLSWLKENKKLENAEFLALTNDSLFYPASFSERLVDFMSEDRQWYALFECFEKHYHTQSFFQILRKEMFLSSAFESFWRSYKPYSSRKYAIDKGEVEFSRQMLGAGFQPHVMFNSARVCADVLVALSSEPCDPGVIFALKCSMGHEYFQIINRNKNNPIFVRDRKALDVAVAIDMINNLAYQIEERNPTQSIGLLCNVLYEAPIKRDIVYREIIETGVLLSQCRGFTMKEKALMSDDLRQKGRKISMKFSPRLLALYNRGRI
jgi:hypothetical protein